MALVTVAAQELASQPLRPVADANHDCYLPKWQTTRSHSAYTEQKRSSNFGAGALKKRPPRAEVCCAVSVAHHLGALTCTDGQQ